MQLLARRAVIHGPLLVVDKLCSVTVQANPQRRAALADTSVTVAEDGVVGWEYNEPSTTLVRAHDGLEPIFNRRIGANRQAPRAPPTTNTEARALRPGLPSCRVRERTTCRCPRKRLPS